MTFGFLNALMLLGLAGLYAALQAAELGARVTLVSKGSLRSSNSFYAQGGVAAAIGPDDDPSQHMADTMLVGRGLCDPRAERMMSRRLSIV